MLSIGLVYISYRPGGDICSLWAWHKAILFTGQVGMYALYGPGMKLYYLQARWGCILSMGLV